MEIPAHVPKVGKTPVHWLLEGLFIVLSVGLAFGVGQYRESRADHELAARVLKSLQAEVEHNLAILEPLQPIHRKWADVLAKADRTVQHRARVGPALAGAFIAAAGAGAEFTMNVASFLGPVIVVARWKLPSG